MEENPPKNKSEKKSVVRLILILLAAVFIVVMLVYLFWLRPLIQTPLSAALSLPTWVDGQTKSENQQATSLLIEEGATQQPGASGTSASLQSTPTIPKNVPAYVRPTIDPARQPLCGDETEWLVLLVGVDYQGEGYLYGLADVIRIARIDFVNMQVNLIPLSRDLLVDIPDGRISVEGPIKLNQAYLFGTEGMGHYVGSGFGAGALAEVIQQNFGVGVDHYAVINFDTFVRFVDSIGGINVNLPNMVSDPKLGDFHSGEQWLSGERALALARIRTNYSDSFRVSNQSIILRGVMNKMMQPAMILKLPGLLAKYKNAFLTDISVEQIISLGVCFLNNFETDQVHIFQVPNDLLQSDHAYIPTLNNTAFVYRWDIRFVEWVHQSLANPE